MPLQVVEVVAVTFIIQLTSSPFRQALHHPHHKVVRSIVLKVKIVE